MGHTLNLALFSPLKRRDIGGICPICPITIIDLGLHDVVIHRFFFIKISSQMNVL